MAATAKAKWLGKFNIDSQGAKRLEHALNALVDNEGPMYAALDAVGCSRNSLAEVCAAIRHIIDGPEDES